MAQEKKRKGEGRRLNDAERLEIIKVIEGPKPPSLRKIARDFGIGEKTIRDVKAKKEQIKARTANSTEYDRLNTKRVQSSKFPKLEEVVFHWLTSTRQAGIGVPPRMLQRKARLVAQEMDISEDEFKASNGWLEKFRKRWKVDSAMIGREKIDANKNELDVLQQIVENDQMVPQMEASEAVQQIVENDVVQQQMDESDRAVQQIVDSDLTVQNDHELLNFESIFQNLGHVRRGLEHQLQLSNNNDCGISMCLDTCDTLGKQIQRIRNRTM